MQQVNDMRVKRSVSSLFTVSLSLLVLGGCATGGGSPGTVPQAAADGSLQCPRGFTVTCEVRKVGRIHHGTFGKSYDSCACVHDSQRGTVSVIPRIR